MELLTYTSGLVSTNSYYVSFQEGEGYLIDAPDGNEAFLASLKERGKPLTAVLLTHGHFDHTAGLKTVRTYYPEVEIFLGMKDWYMLEKKGTWNQSTMMEMGIPAGFWPKDTPDTFTPYLSMNGPFWVFATPGHTMGSVCLYEPENKVLFSGDTLFQGGEGRTDLGGDYKSIRSSLEILMDLPDDTVVYPGHGPRTTIGLEKRFH